MTNYELYHGAERALSVFEDLKTVVHVEWAFAIWLDIEGADELDELAYLEKLRQKHIITLVGRRRLEKLYSQQLNQPHRGAGGSAETSQPTGSRRGHVRGSAATGE